MPNNRRKSPTPLMKSLRFTWDDLHANRAGRIGDGQRRRLAGVRFDWTLVVITALLLMPIFSAPLIEKLANVLLGAQNLFSPSLPVQLITAAAPLLLLIHGMRGLDRINADINGGVVAVAEGVVRCETLRRGQRVYERAVTVGALRFVLRKRVYDSFADGQPHRLYFTPRTQVLLGAEHVAETRQNPALLETLRRADEVQ